MLRSLEINNAMNLELMIYALEFHIQLLSDVDIILSSICYNYHCPGYDNP